MVTPSKPASRASFADRAYAPMVSAISASVIGSISGAHRATLRSEYVVTPGVPHRPDGRMGRISMSWSRFGLSNRALAPHSGPTCHS